MTQKEVRARVREAAADRGRLDCMRQSFGTILDRQKENADRIPDLEARKERLRKTKEASVGDEGLFLEALARLEENGFRVIVAKTADAALRSIRDEVKGYDLVVKSKSNVTKEIHLAESLGKDGISVIETDLGDRIIQLSGCEAAHPTGPACHMTRREISELFSKHFGEEVSEDPLELTRVMREEIASYISKARVGVTGANAITASEGAVVIVHNEGNAAKCAMLPDKHIVVTTTDKVVPTLDDAINVTKLQTYLSTGKIVSSYINVITGPSYTADIEKKVYRGMHGPKDVVIVFVDDGRMAAQDKEAMYCIGCGMCLLHCPTYNVLGPGYGTPGHMGGHGAYLAGSLGNLDEAVDAGANLCTSCGACRVVCPASIDIKKGLIDTRGKLAKAKKGAVPEHSVLVASVKNYANPWQVPRRRKANWARGLGLRPRGEVLYFAGCSTSLLSPDAARKVVRVMRACGVEPAYLGQAERCCGSTARKLGEEPLARELAEACFADFKKAGARQVVTSCPGCSSALNHYSELPKKHGIQVLHLSQFICEHLAELNLTPVDIGPATYHDPCDLGREQGVYEEPRKVLAAVLSTPTTEMERSREMSGCCGSGGGVRSAYPELAAEIGKDRIQMARDVGAATIITSCPWCRQNLLESQGEAGSMPVVDLVELIDRALADDQR